MSNVTDTVATTEQYPQANWARALWLAASADIASASIEVDSSYVVYGVTFTVTVVGTGVWPMITATDPAGASFSFPKYVPNQLATAQSAGQQPLPPY